MATIITKFSSTASAVPTASDLVQGELAVNTADKRLFTEDSGATIIEIGTNPSSITTGTISASGTITSSSGFSGNLTGNVTGNVTGDLTGDVTGNVTAASGTTTLNNLSVGGSVTGTLNTADLAVTGNITVSGTVDGRDVATDGTKLDTIETNADVTDSTNVDAAGAVMNTDTTTASMSFVIDEDNMVSDLDTKVPTQQSVKKYVDDTVIAIGGVTVSPTPTAGQYARWTSGSELEGVDLDIDPTKGTLTKTFLANEQSTITLSSAPSGQPVVSVTKEIPQTGVSNNSWDVDATQETYEIYNSAYADTLDLSLNPTSATYNSVSFSVVTQGANPQGIQFSADGTKMFVLDGDRFVYEYDLATAFDVSTASYNSVSFSVSTEELTPNDLAFNNDGTKMFIVGQAGDEVNEYNLTTGFDLSTATYSQNFSVASQLTAPQGIAFSNDGTSMFVVGWSSDAVFQYDLTTGFDVSTASYASKTLSVAAQDVNPSSIAFNTNGTRMYILGWTSDDVFKYTLTTPFDLSTASYTRVLYTGAEEASPHGLAFSSNYQKMYIVGETSDTVFQYDVAGDVGAFSLGTGSFASADVGKTVEANSGVFVLTATDGSCIETTAPTSYDQVASGSWGMYAVVYNTTDGDLELSSVIDGAFFDVSAAFFSQSFSVNAQETSPNGLAFSTDGTKMFIVGQTGDDVNEYTLSTAFDVSTASFVDSLSVNGQDSQPNGLTFNPDGTKMFVVGNNGDDINEYTLSTGFDVSTGTFVDSFSVISQETSPRGIAFNTDGTKMFVCGTSSDSVHEYSLTTGFDVSTGTFSQTFDTSVEVPNPYGLAFNTDGTKMFVVGNGGASIVAEYTLTTGFDISTASHLQSTTISEDSTAVEIKFNPVGNKFFILGQASDTVYEYEILQYIPSGYHAAHTTSSIDSTYWTDINSMTVDEAPGAGNVYYAVSTDDRTTWSVIDDADGVRDIVRNNGGTWEYNSNGTYASETWTTGTTNTELATLEEAMEGASYTVGFDLTVGAFVDSFDISAQETAPTGLSFNTDGTKMFVVGAGNDSVFEYTLSTGFDVSSATYSQSFSVSSQDLSPQSVSFNTDGTKMFVLGDAGNDINEYTLSTGFDVSTASYSQNFSVGGQETSPLGMTFNTDGTKMFIVGSVGQDINEYTLSTGFDISTAAYSQNLSVSSQEVTPVGVAFNSDGTQMFVIGSTDDEVNEYTLSTGFDISTASFTRNFLVSSQDTAPQDIAFSADGTKMFVVGFGAGGDVHEYTTGSTTYINQMDKTQLEAVTDANHFTLGNDLDLAIVFNQTASGAAPSSDGVSINYDANTLEQGAVLGTDYNWDYPASGEVRITALQSGNYKVRVV